MIQGLAFDIVSEACDINQLTMVKGLIVPLGTRVSRGIPIWEPPKDSAVLTKLLLGIKKKKQIVEEEDIEPIVEPLLDSSDDGQSSVDQSEDEEVSDDAQDTDDS